ncbi:MAG: patatin-like phospholipase family protein [Bacteroidota bacterium]
MKSPLFQNNTHNRSLVLAGGGVRLAYHAGVIKALEEEKISFNHVDGTSGGIFNTAMLASGQNPDEIMSRWRKLNVFNFMSPTPLFNYLKLGRINAFGDADGIREKVFPTLGIDLAKINQNNRFKATFNVCNFSTKEIESIADSQVSEDHLVAGMSLPIFMPSIKIGEDWYTDAVWVKDANLMEAVKRGAQEIYLVYCIGNSRDYFEGSFLQYVHMIEMSAAGGLLAEFDWLQQINNQIVVGKSPYGQKDPIKLQVIKPTYPLPLDPDLFFGNIDIRALINMGYADTKSSLQAIPQNGISLDYKAAQMNEPGISFQFMAKFEGGAYLRKSVEKVNVYLLFDFRKIAENQMITNFFGSIKLQNHDHEIILFDTKVQLLSENGKKRIVIEGKLIIADKLQELHGEIELKTKIDFRLGLEFKTMQIQMDGGEKTILTQKVSGRLKSILKSKIYQNASYFRKQKSKSQILDWIYAN